MILEKTIKRKVKSRFMIRMSDVACASIATVLGFIVSPVGFVFSLMYVTYSYMRSTREAFVAIFFVLLTSLSRGVVPTYFSALGFAIYFLLLYTLILRNKNLYVGIPYMGVIVVSAFSYQAYGIDVKALLLPVIWFVLIQQLCSDYTWIKKDFVLSDTMKGIVLFSFALLIAQLLPMYAQIIYLVALLNVIYIADQKSALFMLLITYAMLPIKQVELLIPISILCVFKEQKKEAILLIFISAFFLPAQFETYIYLLIGVAGLFLYPQQHNNSIQIPSDVRSRDNIVKRQMNNYASIFQLLSDYYAQINNVQSELLSSMSSALQYNADMIRRGEGNEKSCEYIKKALEGYQFEVKEIVIEEVKDGCLNIELEVANIKRGELRTTMLPLLEGLLHRKLDIVELRSRRFMNASRTLLFHDQIPFSMDAYADSAKNAYTSNGDTFSIFRFHQSTVCMISDGMGNGERAMKSSRLITSIFQRMMVSGLTQDNAIRCINKLVQSDTFATLDVLCFNKAQGVVYISKSAACPTYLLRNNELYEISGNALPVGIVAQIQPDCFQIDCKAHDEYLMVSDGICMQEIKEWKGIRKGNDVKEDVELFMQLLNSTKRNDDSTVILARIEDM